MAAIAPMRNPRTLWTLALVAGIVTLAYLLSSGGGAPEIVDVEVPVLTAIAQEGEVLFDESCAQCHGQNAAGTDQGPPLVHLIYRPGHHADEAFSLAVTRGVTAHHWRFGNMPPQPDVNEEEVLKIVQYVRELQAANDIE